ncbi:MAG: hypothetical protein P4L61_04290, partial [Candidatus Pacebacteria bacterium]|nr:hypothetical protein [Candidatus Paceibacterota bacterium]
GYVYITTEKKINQLACNTTLTLNPSELAIIDDYKSQLAQSEAAGQADSSSSAVGTSATATTSSTTSASTLIGQNGADGSANTAAAINANIFVRFWNFIKSLF